jgi:hypothetical protein
MYNKSQRLIACFAIIVIAFGFVSCGNDDEDKNPKASNDKTLTFSQGVELYQMSPDALKSDIEQRGYTLLKSSNKYESVTYRYFAVNNDSDTLFINYTTENDKILNISHFIKLNDESSTGTQYVKFSNQAHEWFVNNNFIFNNVQMNYYSVLTNTEGDDDEYENFNAFMEKFNSISLDTYPMIEQIYESLWDRNGGSMNYDDYEIDIACTKLTPDMEDADELPFSPNGYICGFGINYYGQQIVSSVKKNNSNLPKFLK